MERHIALRIRRVIFPQRAAIAAVSLIRDTGIHHTDGGKTKEYAHLSRIPTEFGVEISMESESLPGTNTGKKMPLWLLNSWVFISYRLIK